jgi:hypothetical protein
VPSEKPENVPYVPDFPKAYIVSEILFSLPTAFWIISLLLVGGGHVFGRADLSL